MIRSFNVTDTIDICLENSTIFEWLILEAETALEKMKNNKRYNRAVNAGVKINSNILAVAVSFLLEGGFIPKHFWKLNMNESKTAFTLLWYLFQLSNYPHIDNSSVRWKFTSKFFEDTTDMEDRIGVLLTWYYEVTWNSSQEDIIRSSLEAYDNILKDSKLWSPEEYILYWIQSDFKEILESTEYWDTEQRKMRIFIQFLKDEWIINYNQFEMYLKDTWDTLKRFNVIKDLYFKWYFDEDTNVKKWVFEELQKHFDDLPEVSESEKDTWLKEMVLEIINIIKTWNYISESDYIIDFSNHLLSLDIISQDELIWLYDIIDEVDSDDSLSRQIYAEYVHEFMYKVMYMKHFDDDESTLVSVWKILIEYYTNNGNSKRVDDIKNYFWESHIHLLTQ